jgi:hypothetical protein
MGDKRGILNRKGEMTSTQLILLILTIAGFVIVLLFIMAFKSGSYTEDEICKLSVLTRATSPQALNTYVPLKCTTKKVCLSDGSGKCESALAGENAEVIKLPSGEANAAKKIEEISANAMYDCWNMMGQGKLDLFNGGIGIATGADSQKAVSCVICSRIAFNASDNIINNVSIDSYLRKNKVPSSSLTYLQTFTDAGVSSYAAVDSDVMTKIRDNKVGETFTFGDVNDANQKVGQLAVVFAQIKPGSYTGNLEKLANTGIAVTAASFLMAPTTTTSIATKAIGTVPGLVLTGIGVGGVALYSMSNVYAGKVAAAGYCGQFNSGNPENKDKVGCSGVQIVPYDVKAINNICQSIEGSP